MEAAAALVNDTATASASLVTGYVRLDSANRSHDSYMALGRQFLRLGLPTIAYVDPASQNELGDGCKDCETTFRPAGDVHAPPCTGPAHANPAKDTQEYLAVQRKKSEWLAASQEDADVLAWVDLGILHVPRVGPAEIRGFFDRLPQARRDRITVPSIWGLPEPGQPISVDRPAWHFAGGVLIVPWRLATEFDFLCQQAEAAILAKTGKTTWEVNVWSIVARDNPSLFAAYECDHNCTLFDHFQPGAA